VIGHLTYLDIPADVRSKAAARMREQIRGVMIGNVLSTEQISRLQDRLSRLDQWERGYIPLRPQS
jgi:hypothetical protein